MSQNYSREYRTENDEASASQPLPFDFSPPRVEVLPPPLPGALSSSANPHQMAARGLAQILGLDTKLAFATVGVDLALHGADVVTAGLLIPFSIAAGIVLTVIATRAQMKWFGDDFETACLKGFIIGLLTCIPSPLPYVLFIPAGILGWFHNRRKQS